MLKWCLNIYTRPWGVSTSQMPRNLKCCNKKQALRHLPVASAFLCTIFKFFLINYNLLTSNFYLLFPIIFYSFQKVMKTMMMNMMCVPKESKSEMILMAPVENQIEKSYFIPIFDHSFFLFSLLTFSRTR